MYLRMPSGFAIFYFFFKKKKIVCNFGSVLFLSLVGCSFSSGGQEEETDEWACRVNLFKEFSFRLLNCFLFFFNSVVGFCFWEAQYGSSFFFCQTHPLKNQLSS